MSSENLNQNHLRDIPESESRVAQIEAGMNEEQTPTPLRGLPSSNSASTATDELSVHESCGDLPITTQSTLSPYAEIFVPRQSLRRQIVNIGSLGSGECNSHYQGANHYSSSNARSTTSSVSNRLRINRPNIKTPDEYESYMRSNKVKPMDKLNQAIDMLHSSTASFDTIKTPILELATVVAKDPTFLQVAIRLILNETIHKQNFCYNGARLCVLFDSKIPTFHQMVTDQCHMYLQTYKEKHSQCAKDHETIRGVVNSLGELYFQFIETGLKYQDLKVCSNVLYEAMSVLIHLDVDKELNMKTVCQALKLTGFHLQLSNSDTMNSLLDDIDAAVQDESDDNLKFRVRNIRQLHNTNWGYDVEQSPNKPEVADDCSNDSCLTDTWEDSTYNAECSEIDDTVYYGPDGKVLTAEETSFLYCNCTDTNSTNASDVEDDEDTLWDPENELGPELQRAFKEFVAYSKNQNN